MEKITKDMTFSQALQKFPQAGMVMAQKGMGCVGCIAASSETIEEGALAHGIDVNKLVEEINELMEQMKSE